MVAKEKNPDAIVVALDGSAPSHTGASLATKIARKQHLPIRGLYVIDPTLVCDLHASRQTEGDSVEQAASRVEQLTRLEEHGERALAWLTSYCMASDVPVTTTIERGSVSAVILKETAQAALLALGRRGQSHGADTQHLGHCFRKIAHHTRQPLLVGGDERRPIKRLVLAYNGRGDSWRSLTWAAHLERAFGAEVVVVAVQEWISSAAQWLEDARACLAAHDLNQYRFVQRSGRPATEIVTAAEESEADVIVMGGYHHSTAVVEWLVGSTVDQVLRNTALPVFIA